MSRNATATATGTAVVAKSAGAEAGAGAGPHSPSARTWIPISAAFVVVAVAFCLTHTTFLSYNKGMPPSSPPPPPVPCSSRSSPVVFSQPTKQQQQQRRCIVESMMIIFILQLFFRMRHFGIHRRNIPWSRTADCGSSWPSRSVFIYQMCA